MNGFFDRLRLRRGVGAALVPLALGALLTACGDSASPPRTGGSDRAGYFDTPWPNEHADRWRTHAVKGGLPEGVQSANLVATSVRVPPIPAWGYTRGDHVYVLGGSPVYLGFNADLIETYEPDEAPPTGFDVAEQLAIAKNATPYLAKIDPTTMTARTLELGQGTAVNYTGGALMHENGSIYAVARSVLYRIDADDLSIEDTLALPLLEANGAVDPLTTYNGIQVRANGQLVLKGIDLAGRIPGGTLLLVDPEEMRITARTDSEDVATARVTLAIENGRELLYHSTPTDSVRFVVTDAGFTLDPSWTAAYRSTAPGTTQASSPVYMGEAGAVVFANNTLPWAVTTPMQIFSQSTAANEGGSLVGRQAFANSNPQVNFFMVAADPFVSNVVVVEDQLNGLVAGWRVGDGGSLTRLWHTDAYRVSAGAAIAYEQGHVYVDDRRCDDRGENCTLWVVVLDIETGDHLAETRVAGTQPSVSQMFIGTDAVYFIATETESPHGYVTRVAARR